MEESPRSTGNKRSLHGSDSCDAIHRLASLDLSESKRSCATTDATFDGEYTSSYKAAFGTRERGSATAESSDSIEAMDFEHDSPYTSDGASACSLAQQLPTLQISSSDAPPQHQRSPLAGLPAEVLLHIVTASGPMGPQGIYPARALASGVCKELRQLVRRPLRGDELSSLPGDIVLQIIDKTRSPRRAEVAQGWGARGGCWGSDSLRPGLSVSSDVFMADEDAEVELESFQSARVRMATVAKSMLRAIFATPQEYTLGPLTSDERLINLTSMFPTLTAIVINPQGSLGVSCRGVASKGIAALGRLQHLRSLELHFVTGLQASDFNTLSKSPSAKLPLGNLLMEHAQALTEESARAIATAYPGLERISVGVSGVSDAGLVELTTRCQGLRDVSLRHCHAITDFGAQAIAAGCPHLTNLQLSNLQNITDAGVAAIAAKCPSLVALDVSRSPAIADGALCAIATFSQGLQSLDISWCPNVTDGGVMKVANGCRGLSEIKFEGCRNLTRESIAQVAHMCPALKELQMEKPTYAARARDCIRMGIPEPARNAASGARGLCDSWFGSCMGC